jgi:hypothetical protein
MHEIDRIRVAPQSAIVYEHGWQSWSPSTSYPLHAGPLRPRTENSRIMNCRQETRPPADAFWGEGLLAVDPGDGSGIVVFSAAPDADPVPSIRADVCAGEVAVSADVAVVGFDNSAAATMVEPALTTMRNPIEQSALEALKILDDQIAGRVRRPVHKLLMSSELIERGSA